MTMPSKARRLGNAFRLGVIYATGITAAMDEAKWITVHPNGTGANAKGDPIKGRPVLIDSDTGEILGGMGGKGKGKKLSEMKSKPAAKASGSGRPAASRAKIDLSHPDKIDKKNIIQNRDRSNSGSIQQINSIASKPDYMRMGPSHDLANGAPVVAYGSVDDKHLGNPVTVVDSDGNRYKMQYAVVEASDVLTSNDAQGNRNPEYESDDASRMRAVAGNGRMAGITEGYNRGTADEYRQEMIDDAAASGIDPETVKGMKNPVLVRVMQASDVTPDIGDRTNKQGGLSMTAVEQAKNDRQRINLKDIETYDDGTPTIGSLKQWIAEQPVAERGQMLGKNGEPTKQAMERFQAAIFSKAYDNDYLTEMYGQALDPQCKTIINGLEKAAPKMVNLGDAPDGYDIRDIIGMATEKVVQAKRTGMSLEDVSGQMDMFNSDEKDDLARAIVKMYSKNMRSGAAIGDKLSALAEAMYAEGQRTDDIFGAVEHVPPKEIFRQVLGEDRKPGKMSAQMSAFWHKRGGAFLDAFFAGRGCKTFFSALRKEYSICR